MKKSAISSFSGTPMSGLLKNFATLCDNGGLDEIHLDLLCNKRNPFDEELYKFYEWKFFLRAIFDVGIEEKDFNIPRSDFRLFDKGGFAVIPVTKKLSVQKIIEDWNIWIVKEEKSDLKITTSNYGYKYQAQLALQPHSYHGHWAFFNPVVLSETEGIEVLRGNKQSSAYKKTPLLTEALLFSMFHFWKYGNIDYFRNIEKPEVIKNSITHSFIVPCFGNLYIDQPLPDESKISYPLLVVRENGGMYIYPSAYRSGDIQGPHVVTL